MAKALISGRHELAAIVLPGPPGLGRPVLLSAPDQRVPLANATPPLFAGIPGPVFHVGRLAAPATIALIEACSPDVIVVACFPHRLPRAIRALARLASINVHPSLLPEGRGPDPLFWTLRRGDGRAAVTVHELAHQFDAGPIFAQTAFEYRDGIREEDLEGQSATIGGDLAVTVTNQLVAGTAITTPQDEERATREPWPTPDDYTIDTRRSARAAFNFARGVAGRGHSITVDSDGTVLRVVEAIAYTADKMPLALPSTVQAIRFEDGLLIARTEAV